MGRVIVQTILSTCCVANMALLYGLSAAMRGNWSCFMHSNSCRHQDLEGMHGSVVQQACAACKVEMHLCLIWSVYHYLLHA